MRSAIVALAVSALAGCAYGSVARSPQVSVQSVPAGCVDASSQDGIPLLLTNRGAVPATFSLFSAASPPYRLHPWAAEVAREGAASDHWSIVLEDYSRPTEEIHVGPGDRAEFIAYTPSHPLPGYEGVVVLKIRDIAGHVFESERLHVCAPGSVPNKSFKPNPLRGSA